MLKLFLEICFQFLLGLSITLTCRQYLMLWQRERSFLRVPLDHMSVALLQESLSSWWSCEKTLNVAVWGWFDLDGKGHFGCSGCEDQLMPVSAFKWKCDLKEERRHVWESISKPVLLSLEKSRVWITVTYLSWRQALQRTTKTKKKTPRIKIMTVWGSERCKDILDIKCEYIQRAGAATQCSHTKYLQLCKSHTQAT